MEKWQCLACPYIYDPVMGIRKTEFLREPVLKTFPMAGFALYAACPKVNSRRLLNNL